MIEFFIYIAGWFFTVVLIIKSKLFPVYGRFQVGDAVATAGVGLIWPVVLLSAILVWVVLRIHKGMAPVILIGLLVGGDVYAHQPADKPGDWCLMAWEEKDIQPHCIRTFDSYGWCMFDLKTMVEENAMVPVKFSCHRKHHWQELMRAP